MGGKLDQYATHSFEMSLIVGILAAIVLLVLAYSAYSVGIMISMLIVVLYTAGFIGLFILGELVIRLWKRYEQWSE